MPWEDVKKEMVNEKGLSEEAADQIGEYVRMQGEILPIHRKCAAAKHKQAVTTGQIWSVCRSAQKNETN